jgi:hypothetical protein
VIPKWYARSATAFHQGISIDGETIMHCPVCHDREKVTVEEADRWRREMRGKYGAGK